MPEFAIDPEFENLLPVASEEDDAELELTLEKTEGPRDPLVVWKGHNILLDGHRRYKLCRHRGWPYRLVEVDLPDRMAAKVWMIENQLVRRNVGSAASQLLRVQLVACLEEGGTEDAVQKVADAAKVSKRQVYRDLMRQKDLKKLPPDIRKRIESGDLMGTGTETIHELAAMPESEQRGAVALLDSGQYESLREAVWGKVENDEPISDAMSVGPEPEEEPEPEPEPEPEKPRGIDSMFLNADRQLGLLRRCLDDLGNASPGAHYPKCMALSGKLCDVLAAWRKEAAI